MSLPISRNTTYANGVPVEAADLNDLQDAIIGGKHGEKVLHIPAAAMAPYYTADLVFKADNWESTGAGPESAYIPITLSEGDRILSIRIFVYAVGTEANSILYSAEVDLVAGSSSAVDEGGGAQGSGAGPAYLPIDFAAGSGNLPLTISADKSYYLAVRLYTVASRVYHAEVTYDHP